MADHIIIFHRSQMPLHCWKFVMYDNAECELQIPFTTILELVFGPSQYHACFEIINIFFLSVSVISYVCR